MNRVSSKRFHRQHERNGNIYSGAVAMVLLGLFVLALVSSELDAGRANDGAGASVPALVAGQ